MLVQELRIIQERHGYLPRPALEELSARLNVRLHRLHEVISFFPHYRLAPPPEVEVHVCRDLACHLRKAAECLQSLKDVAGEFGGEARVKVEGVSCLGRCDGAPAALIELHRPGHPDQARVLQRPAVGDYAARLRVIVAAHLDNHAVPADAIDRSPRPWRIDPYQAPTPGEPTGTATEASPDSSRREPYAAVVGFGAELKQACNPTARRAVAKGLIDTLTTSDLRGMGGAGRPAYSKWGEVRDESERAQSTYVICNADESEPSTFKDREILLRAPHLVIEGMVLGALVVGARQGYVYIRHEYFDQIHAVEAEIQRARALGVLGADVLGTGHAFELEVFESPGGYICGEQSALIEAIEEHRAEPRNRPPVIEANGLFNQPTLLNNVETFAWVPAIVLNGGVWYRDHGVADTSWYIARRQPNEKPEKWPRGKGLRFFSICGDVARPGVYEVPVGLPLGELVAMAGGMRGGLPLVAVAPSGPSGGFLPATLTPGDLPAKRRGNFLAGRTELSVLELPLDKAEFDELGLMLGAGLLVVAGLPGGEPAAQMLNLALNATRFFSNESCGKCVPCRIGSQKLVQIGEQLENCPTDSAERAKLIDLVRALQETMEQTSICGLGTSASKPMASLFEHDWHGINRPPRVPSSLTASAAEDR
jgi:NADH:ubiquinone oxidoreductase subunit F (NADH-binding)/NADH:ubiquinone oxidoreductase subunit E